MSAVIPVPDLHPVVAVDHDSVKTWLIICGCGAHIATAGTLTEAITRFGEHIRTDTYNTATSAVRRNDGAISSEPGSVSRFADRVRRALNPGGVVRCPENTSAATA